jgi:plastocyanin
MFTSFLARGRSVAVAATLVAAAAMPASAETITVTIENLSFKPTEVKAKVGDTILWVNKDVLDHTATARDKSFDIIQTAKKSVSQTLTKAGSFDFYCRYHPNMTGRLLIEP